MMVTVVMVTMVMLMMIMFLMFYEGVRVAPTMPLLMAQDHRRLVSAQKVGSWLRMATRR